MKQFETENELEAWLEALDYEDFWTEMTQSAVTLPAREECDDRISQRVLTQTAMLETLRHLAKLELSERYGLEWEDPMPLMSVH